MRTFVLMQVGACATAAESVDIGVETINSGKARVVIVGGYDDFSEEVRPQHTRPTRVAADQSQLHTPAARLRCLDPATGVLSL